MAKKVPKVLTDEELQRILEQPNLGVSSGRRNKAMIMLMAYSGLRAGEVIELRTGDLRRNGGGRVTELHLTHTKGGQERVVPVPPHVADALEYWLTTKADMGIRSRHVFTTISKGTLRHPKTQKGGQHGIAEGEGETVTKELKRGRPLSGSYVRQMVKRVAERAGVGDWVHPHTLRHTAATRLLREGGNLEVVRKFLGHSHLSTTQIYLEVEDAEVAEAVNGVSDVEAKGAGEADLAEQIAALQQQLAEVEAKLTQ